MMNDVLLGGNKAVVSQNESVRVQCEAADCGALLEIEVPTGQYHSSLIVRCGNCHRSGRKQTTEGVYLPLGDPTSASFKRCFHDAAVPQPLHLSPPHRAGVAEGMKRSSGLTSIRLARPPPLSRAHAVPSASREVVSGLMSAAPHLQSPYSFSPSTPFSTVASDPALSQYSMSSLSNGVKTESDSGRRGSGGKSKKDRGTRHASPYNRFMSQEVKRIKAAHPDVDHRKAFKMAASNWARSPTSCQKIAAEIPIQGCDTPENVESPLSMTESNEVVSSQNVESSGWLANSIQTSQNGIHGAKPCKEELSS